MAKKNIKQTPLKKLDVPVAPAEPEAGEVKVINLSLVGDAVARRRQG